MNLQRMSVLFVNVISFLFACLFVSDLHSGAAGVIATSQLLGPKFGPELGLLCVYVSLWVSSAFLSRLL